MSDTESSGFGKFVPGFDFLQSLAKNASSSIPQLPNLANWVAPTLNVEELDKRISELKNVHFWLDQNARALSATIQALEVQRMTLATLRGMNFNLGDVANAFKLKAADSVVSGVQRATEKAAARAEAPPAAEAAATKPAPRKSAAKKSATAGTAGSPVAGLVDPLNLWSSLTQQFQQIASTAMKDAATKTAVDVTRNMATGLAKDALSSAAAAGRKTAQRKTPAARKRAG